MKLALGNSLATQRIGGAVGFSAEAQQFFDRLLTPPDDARALVYAAFIDALVAGGVWAKLDGLYVFCAADEGTALTNLVSSNYTATRRESAGTVTFTVDEGVSGGGAVRYLSTQFNPTTAASPNFTQNDAMIGGWSSNDALSTNQQFVGDGDSGTAPAGGDVKMEFYPVYNGTSTVYFMLNAAGPSITATNPNGTDSSGLFLGQRYNSASQSLLQNGGVIASGAGASSAPNNAQLYFRCVWPTRLGLWGASLNTGQRNALQDACENLIASITGGVP